MHYAKSMDICMLLPAFNFTQTFLSPYDIDYHPLRGNKLAGLYSKRTQRRGVNARNDSTSVFP